jgi:hypothetical protein
LFLRAIGAGRRALAARPADDGELGRVTARLYDRLVARGRDGRSVEEAELTALAGSMVELFDAEAGRGGPFAGEPELLWDAWMVVDPEVAAATRAAPVAPGLRDELTRTVVLERRGLLHAERRLEAWAARQEPKPNRGRPSKRDDLLAALWQAGPPSERANRLDEFIFRQKRKDQADECEVSTRTMRRWVSDLRGPAPSLGKTKKADKK